MGFEIHRKIEFKQIIGILCQRGEKKTFQQNLLKFHFKSNL